MAILNIIGVRAIGRRCLFTSWIVLFWEQARYLHLSKVRATGLHERRYDIHPFDDRTSLGVCFPGTGVQGGFKEDVLMSILRRLKLIDSRVPAHAKREWEGAPYSWNMVNLFVWLSRDWPSVRTYIRVYRLYGWGRGGYQKEGGVSQACLGKCTSFT